MARRQTRYNKYVEFYRRMPHYGDVDVGLDEERWEKFTHAYADIITLSGRELVQEREVHAEVTHKIMMRYQPGITADMRIDRNGRTLQIHSVVDTQNDDLVMMCTESV